MINHTKKKVHPEKTKESVNPQKRRKMGAKALKKLVFSSDPTERKEAAYYLGEEDHIPRRYFGFLQRLIKDEEEDVWNAACIVLGRSASRDAEAYGYIRSLVDEDYFWVQKRGINALGELAQYDHRGITHLTTLTDSGRKETVEEAIKVLGRVAKKDADALITLTRLLRSKEEFIIQHAIFTLGILARDRNEPLKKLKPFLKDNTNFIRLWAATAIGEAASLNDEAFALFRKLEGDNDVYLRRGFSKGLASVAKVRPDEAMKLIDRSVEDSDMYVRTNAARALGAITIKNKKAFTRIKQLLNHEKGDVRRGAAEALLNIAEEMQGDILPLLKELVKDEDYYLRSVAAFALVNIADISSKDAIKLLETLVEDRDEYVRRDAAFALGKLAESEAEIVFPYLKKLLEDRESIVRREAAKSIKMVVKVKTDEILDIMPILTNDFDSGVRENTAELLGEVAKSRTKNAFDHMREMALDDIPRVQEKVAKSLEILFDLEPYLFFTRIKILQRDGIRPEVLELVAKFARDEEIGKVTGINSVLMSKLDEYNMENSLTLALEVLETIKTLKYSEEIKKLFKTLLLGIRSRNINDIALIKFSSETIKSIYRSIGDVESGVFGVLEEVPEMALRYKQTEGLSDKHIYLGKMLGHIDSTLENLHEEKTPEKKILKQVLLNWRGVLSQTMDDLKGSANIKVMLRTKKLLPLDTLTLLLSIANIGESQAENLEIELLSSPSYKIIDKTKKIEVLPHERKDAVEFRIVPTKKRNFRVKFNVSFDDFERKGKSIYFADRVSFIEIPREFKYIPNPYIAGGPIKPRSKDMFFGREDVFDFIKDNISSRAQKNMLILQGERRTGKTSILYRIPKALGPEYICAFVDGQEFGGASLDYLLYRMAKQISNACTQHGIRLILPSLETFKENPWYVFKDQFLEELSGLLGDKYLVILFDEFESLEHAVTNGMMDAVVFDYIRNLMQHEERLVFIFAGVHKLEEMMQDYWGVLFNITLYWRISFLEENMARNLITKPVEGYNMLYDDLAIEKIIRATACHPYFIQLLCRFLVNRHNVEKRNYITVQDVNEELSNVVEKAKSHFNYVWALSSPLEKMLLAILPGILRKKEVATITDILEVCENKKLEISKERISSAIKTLTVKDLLERISNGDVHYRFKVDFIRMWVDKHQPLSKVIEEIGGEVQTT